MNQWEDDDDFEDASTVVRPYMLTRGRTRSAAATVVMESLVDRAEADQHQLETLEPAQRRIWDLLEARQSAAELSAKLNLPLGIVCVLVGDMTGEGLLVVHETASTGDVDLVRRLIDGVRAL